MRSTVSDKEPPNEAELQGIKNYMAGIYVLQNSTRSGVINQLENMNYNELDKNYRSITMLRSHRRDAERRAGNGKNT